MQFNLPPKSELLNLSEEQLKPIFFQLEEYRSKRLLEVSDNYVRAVETVEKEYGNFFQVLADTLANVRRNNKEPIL